MILKILLLILLILKNDKKSEDVNIAEFDTKYGGFFINCGNLDLIPMSEVLKEEEFIKQQEDLQKIQDEFDQSQSPTIPEVTLHPDLEAAIKDLEVSTPKDISGRFPKHLEPQLAKVAQIATKLHPKGHLTNDIFVRLIQFLPFKKSTLKSKMKKLLLN